MKKKSMFNIGGLLVVLAILSINFSINAQKNDTTLDISSLVNSAQASGECRQTMRYCDGSFSMNWACEDNASMSSCSYYYCIDCN